LLEASSLLSKLPEQERWQVFSTHPLFQAIIPEEMRAQIQPEHLSDQGLQMFAQEVKAQLVKFGNGGVAEYRPGQPLNVLREPTQKAPAGFRYTDEGDLEVDPGYVRGRAAISGATRAPPRAGSGGGGSAAPSSGKPPWERSW
jgi:hypothetical protein